MPEIDNPIISRRMRLSRDVFGQVGFCSLNPWDAVPPHANRVPCKQHCFRVRVEIELGKESTGASTVARDRERVKRAWHEDRD